MQKQIRKVKAFTLVELIVVMAIIAILVGLSVGGISIVQRNARDQERIAALSEVNLELESYRGANGRYPTESTTAAGANVIFYAPGSISVGNRSVPLRGAATGNTGAVTSTSTTDYCYSVDASGASYTLAAQLESGGVTRFGNAPASDCTVGTTAGF